MNANNTAEDSLPGEQLLQPAIALAPTSVPFSNDENSSNQQLHQWKQQSLASVASFSFPARTREHQQQQPPASEPHQQKQQPTDSGKTAALRINSYPTSPRFDEDGQRAPTVISKF